MKTIKIIYFIDTVGKLTIRRFFSNYNIRVNVSMNNMAISTSANSSFYAHQAVFLHHNKTKQFKESALNLKCWNEAMNVHKTNFN